MASNTFAITVSKLIAAPVDRVWETWSRPEHYTKVHESRRAEIDFRPGGTNRVYFGSDDEVSEVFEYLEIVPPERLAFCWLGHDAYPITVTFEPALDGTLVSIEQGCGDDPMWMNNCLDGWAWILDSLESYLATGEGLGNVWWTANRGGFKVVKDAAGES